MSRKIDLNKHRENNKSIGKRHTQNFSNRKGLNSDSSKNNDISSNSVSAIPENKELTTEVSEINNVKIKIPLSLKMVITSLIFIPLFALMLFVTVFGDNDGISGGSIYGISGKEYYIDSNGNPGCTQVKVSSGLVSIDEYAAGVVAGEVGGFDIETQKVFAVAARTYLIQTGAKIGNGDDCYYDGTEIQKNNWQVYRPDKVTDQHREAANLTKGIIITINNKPLTYYDASCVYTASQAQSVDSEGNYSDDNYYIKYGENFGLANSFQAIPKSESNIGTLNYYASFADNGTACSGNHGWGMSQNGAAYLSQKKSMTYEEIIDYYYQGKAVLKSLYKSFGYSGEYPIEPNNEIYQSTTFLINNSLSEFLASKDTDIASYNDFLNKQIDAAGKGTRNGVVAAGVGLIGSLAEMGIKLNYQWGGKYATLGINPNWGTPASTEICRDSYASHGYDVNKCLTNYKWQSFDCSGFVTWAIINGTGDTSITQTQIFNSKRTNLNANTAVCKPGGVLQSSGHIVLVVGTNDETKQYIVAESTGSVVANNSGGVKLSYYSYGATGYWCSNLDEIYGD